MQRVLSKVLFSIFRTNYMNRALYFSLSLSPPLHFLDVKYNICVFIQSHVLLVLTFIYDCQDINAFIKKPPMQ